MATSGSFNTSSVGNFYFTFEWYRTGYDSASNVNYIHYTLTAHNTPGNYRTVYLKNLYINGSQVFYEAGTAGNGKSYYNNSVVTSGDITVYNSTAAGDGNLAASFEAGVGSYPNANCSGSGEWALDRIPRYVNITSFSVSKRDETSVTLNWTADASCDYAWYSTNNGSSWNALPNSNIVSGLSAGTGYNFKLRLRRTDSQLTTDSGAYWQSTYDYPYVTSAPNFIIGNTNTISFYNPLGRSCAIYIKNAAGTEYGGDTTTGTSVLGYTNSTWKNFFYAGIPNSKNGTYRVRLVCSAVGRDTTVNGGTYYCNDNECKPTYAAANVSYYDSNATVTAITQNNQHIVQNKSNLKVTCSGASARNGASISSYRAVFNGVTRTGTGDLNFGTVNLSNSANVSITAIDSRGYETTVTKQITILAYSSPTAVLTAYRKNNYEDENYFKCDASISSVNGKNSMTILYGYAQGASSSPTAATSINNNTFVTNSLDKTYEYRFIAKVTDRFESNDFYIVLPKGVFIEFWDTQKLSVGINGFPTHNKSFEVFGNFYLNDTDIFSSIQAYANQQHYINCPTAWVPYIIPLDAADIKGSAFLWDDINKRIIVQKTGYADVTCQFNIYNNGYVTGDYPLNIYKNGQLCENVSYTNYKGTENFSKMQGTLFNEYFTVGD